MKSVIVLSALVLVTTVASALAQENNPPTAGTDTLKVQLVVSRSEGDKKIATVPLSLAVVTTGAVSRLSMGTEIPVATTPPGVAVTSVNYRSVGTAVNASAKRLNDGRYQLSLKVEATWVGQPTAKDSQVLPQFGSFHAEEELVLSDGGSSEFTSAADAATGQVVRVDVTVTKPR